MSKLVQDAPRPPVVGTITQFLTTLPSPLAISLVSLAPQIRFVRWFLEALSWKRNWDESWLLLAAWWALCLGSEAVVRYLLPITAVVALWWITRRSVRRAAQPQLATEETLHRTVSDLTTIQELWPRIPTLCTAVASNPASPEGHEVTPLALPLHRTLRILAFVYPPYLLITLTGFVRVRTLLGIAGTLLALYRAPFAVLIRRALWRSAYFRWGIYWTWAKVSGAPLPSSIRPPPSDVSVSVTASKSDHKAGGSGGEKQTNTPVNAIRFLFSIYENQRWWMGLDWTAALLPGERPSWCSRSLQPCAPPAAFALPPATIVYVPDPADSSPVSRKGKDQEKSKSGTKRWMKRTACWRWEEPEWKVVVRKEGAPSTTRVERPLPSLVEEGASAGANKILRAAGKFRGASLDLSPERRLKELDTGHAKESSAGSEGEKGGERAADDARTEDEDEEPFTDADGWVYGDNKWEGGSAKGGMGKYTRYRRWTRVAMLHETVEWVDDADVPADAKLGRRLEGIAPQPSPEHAASAPPSVMHHEAARPNPMRKPTLDSTAAAPTYASHITAEPTSPTSAASEEGSRLRQRLKAVVNGVGH